ncbi:hypothetical protein ACFY2T_15810 [Streptomyces sp. NPDC001260]|uniref:hypothetical protein n=1 Tax=Streptomyces sp. NPDC001260 TaxID=3364551 RepID=UPI0036AFB097
MTVYQERIPLVLLPGPDTPVAEVAGLVRALPDALRPVVLRPGTGASTRPGPPEVLARQVRDAGVRGSFAVHGWGTGAYLGLALAGVFERALGHAVCTTLFVSDAVAPGRTTVSPVPADVRRTVTESRLVVCTDRTSARFDGSGLRTWCRHTTSGTEFVTLPSGPRAARAAALSRLIAARLLPATGRPSATRAARTTTAHMPGGDVVAGSAP